MFFVNNKMLSIFEKFTRFGLASAKANHAADILAVTEDDALRNARRVLFTNLI